MTTEPSTTPPDRETHEVDPERLDPGEWSHTSDRWIGRGDIAASYCADRIGMSNAIRKPFEWRGRLWVCTGTQHPSGHAEVYAIVEPHQFPRAATTYAEKVRDAEAARKDPHGFYDGMTVKHGGKTFVVCGPPVAIVPGRTQQASLFDASADPQPRPAGKGRAR